MGKWDVSEWVPSEEELRAELCNAREIDWPAEASKYINYLDEWSIGTSCDYGEYMRGLLKDGRNFPEIPLRYMESPADWIDRPLEFILNQILNSPEEYQGYIMGMVNRYLTACFKRLDGRWPSDRWDGSGNPYFTRNCYTFCCPESVGDDDLLKKIIVLQKLQTMISDRVRQDEPVNRIEEPAAVDGAAADQDNEFASNIKRFKGQRGLPMSVITTECRRIAERETRNLRRGVKGLIEMLVAENEAVLREVYPNSKNLVSFVYGHCKSDEKIKEIAREHSGSKR